MAARAKTAQRLVVVGAALLGGAAGYALGYNLLLDWVGQQAHALFWYQARVLLESETFYRMLAPTLLGAALAAVAAVALLRRR